MNTLESIRPQHPALLRPSRSLDPTHWKQLPTRVLQWGCCEVPLSALAPHSVLIGTPGSGKTLLLKLFMKSLLVDPHFGLTYRAAIFDPKREFYRFLIHVGVPADQVIVTHPYDVRSSAWHIAEDFTDESHAQTLADAIIPRRPETPDQDKTKDPNFWINASNQTILDIVLGLMKQCPDNWDLRDITEACSHPDSIRQMLRLTPSGQDSHRFYFEGRGELAMDILATLRSYVREFEPLAALWHAAETRFSIRRWRDGSGLLLLGWEPERPHLLRTINTLLIRRISQVLLARLEEYPPDLSWLFFDELREAGRFEGFQSLLTNGRSKGVRVVLAFQDTFGLNAAFGTDEAKEILAICDNKAILHLGSPDATQWASDLFHEREREVESGTTSDDQKTSRSVKIERVREILPIQFHELPLAQNRNGEINAYFHHPELAYRGHLPSATVHGLLPMPSADELPHLPPPFIERPREHQQRVPWDKSDFARIGIRPSSGSSSTTNGRRQLRVMPWHKE